jgi:tetratricopeptide (TPR) repeat protein
MRSQDFLTVIAIILLLLAAIIAPIIFSGYFDLRAAQDLSTQSKFSDASKKYESAAGKLFWRGDLWEQAGLSAYRAQNINDSIRLLETARAKNSLTDIGWYALGLAYWMNQDHKTALAVWQSGAQQYPNYALLYDRLAAADHETGDYAPEQIALVKRLTLADDASAHYRLALLLTLSDSDSALKHLSAASSLDPQFDSVVETLRATLNIAALDNNPSTKMITIGRGLGLVNEWGLASKAFESAVSADGKNAEAWAWLGEAKQQNGQAGSDELNKALELNPINPVVRGLRGLYWKRQGKFAEALNEYFQAAQLDPQNPAWQISIGEAYTQNGNLIAALAAYQNATTLAPGDATYWRLLAMFCADNGVQVAEIGLPAAQKAAEISPNDPQVLDALGWTYLNAGYPLLAEDNLLRAEKAAPDSAVIHLHLAEMYLQKSDSSSALNELNLARNLDPNGAAGNFAGKLLKQYFP